MLGFVVSLFYVAVLSDAILECAKFCCDTVPPRRPARARRARGPSEARAAAAVRGVGHRVGAVGAAPHLGRRARGQAGGR